MIKGRQHDNQNEVATVLLDASVFIIDPETKEFNSGHYIYHDEKFLLLTVSHGVKIQNSFDCQGEIDVQIASGCPIKSAINVSNYVPLRMGDQASASGFIYDYDIKASRFWTGSLAGKLGHSNTHEESKIIFLADEYIFQGIAELRVVVCREARLSMALAGYTGMVHGSVSSCLAIIISI